MRKQIAVFICAISFDNQRRVLQGILKRSREQDIDVFIFTCHVNYNEDEENKIGAFGVMQLPDIHCFDGVILMKNSIQYAPAAEELVRRILASGVPAVSIDEEIQGMHNIGISNYAAQRKLVDDLIERQGLTRIHYVTGITSSWEGRERYQAYLDAMEKHNLRCEESSVYHGDYGAASGRAAVVHFMREIHEQPQAIVFANDAMALGGIEQLSELGYSVPGDLYVTGFDNDEQSRIYRPSLSTVDRRQEDMGYLAVELIEEGTVGESRRLLEPRVIFGESSGRMENFSYTLQELRTRFTAKNYVLQQAIDEIKHMSLDLAGLESTDELFWRLRRYIQNSDMHSFYLCMCDSRKLFQLKDVPVGDEIRLNQIHIGYTPHVSMPVAYQDGVFRQYQEFESRVVLPEECRIQGKPSFYIVSPVYYRNICFGYCVSEGSEFAMRSELASSWVVNIGIALENIRKYVLMNQMVKRLNGMWKYDMLTQLYNRRGFFYYAKKRLNEIKICRELAYILFLDLDGLKQINDGMGHECGDAFIREMADILRESMPQEAVVMRYGGDEFVVFGACVTAEQANGLVDVLRERIAVHNRQSGRKWKVAASIGCSVFEAGEVEDLSSRIEQADLKMYEEKKKKRTR